LVCSFFAAFLAIDDVNIVDKRCETAYFSVNDYAQLLNATEKGSNFLSNLLFNEDGYAFKVLVSLLPLICLSGGLHQTEQTHLRDHSRGFGRRNFLG